MSESGAYGQRLGDAFHVEDAHSFVARSLRKTEIAVTQMRRNRPSHRLTEPVPCEEGFLLILQIRDWPKRILWQDGKPVRAEALKAGTTSIFDLRSRWIGYGVSPFHSISLYLPRQALNAIADLEGIARVDHLENDPVTGVDDPIISELGSTLLPAFDRRDEASQLFVDHVTLAIAAHTMRAYGGAGKLAKARSRRLSAAQLRNTKEMIAANLDGEISLSQLAELCDLPPSAFGGAFARSVGLSPHRWLLQQRLEKAMALLRRTVMPLEEIAFVCGFVSLRHFERVFLRATAMSPREFRAALAH